MLMVQDLSLTFRADGRTRPIFPQVSFKLASGEILAIVGDSGAGKTSLLNVIAGFIRPATPHGHRDAEYKAITEFLPRAHRETPYLTGDVLIEGKSVLHLPPSRRNVGMLLQNFSVFEDRSILDNMTFSTLVRGVAKGDRLRAAERHFHLLKFDIGSTPVGKFLEGRASKLSGGERQRVALVRLVIERPPIWLLDEPYANLDAIKREEISNDIRKVISDLAAQGVHICALIVCHDLQEALHADKLLVLADHDRAPEWAYAEKRENAFVVTQSSPSTAAGAAPIARWIDRLTRDKILAPR